MAVAAVVVLEVQRGPSPGVVRSGPGATAVTLSPSPGAAAGDISAAASVTCRTDFAAVQQAAEVYTTEHGHEPAALSDLAGALRDPVSSPHFTISVGSGGVIEVAAPGHPPAPGDGNCAYAG